MTPKWPIVIIKHLVEGGGGGGGGGLIEKLYF